MIQKPKGTRDILPEEVYKWQYVEKKISKLFDNSVCSKTGRRISL